MPKAPSSSWFMGKLKPFLMPEHPLLKGGPPIGSDRLALAGSFLLPNWQCLEVATSGTGMRNWYDLLVVPS